MSHQWQSWQQTRKKTSNFVIFIDIFQQKN